MENDKGYVTLVETRRALGLRARDGVRVAAGLVPRLEDLTEPAAV